MQQLVTNTFALLVAVGLASPCLAAPSTLPKERSPATSQQNATETSPSTTLRQQVANDLSKAGFTDIKIMPESFLVRAKDSKGDPVMMVINPDSFTAVTQLAPPKASASAHASGDKSGNSVLSGANANGDPTPPSKQ